MEVHLHHVDEVATHTTRTRRSTIQPHVDLMKWVATQLATQKLTSIDINEVIKAGNLNNLGELEHMGEEWIKWAFESLTVRLK